METLKLATSKEKLVHCYKCEKDVPQKAATWWYGGWLCLSHFDEHEESDFEALF